jgi:hypothetical protein
MFLRYRIFYGGYNAFLVDVAAELREDPTGAAGLHSMK